MMQGLAVESSSSLGKSFVGHCLVDDTVDNYNITYDLCYIADSRKDGGRIERHTDIAQESHDDARDSQLCTCLRIHGFED